MLSEWRPHVELGALPDRRVDHALEAGIYFLVVALTTECAVVDVRVEDDVLIEVTTLAGGDLTEIEDRVGALGGVLTVTDTDAARRVQVRLACA